MQANGGFIIKRVILTALYLLRFYLGGGHTDEDNQSSVKLVKETY